eukprot:14774340-Alexandrium_andersonii.AAC.1
MPCNTGALVPEGMDALAPIRAPCKDDEARNCPSVISRRAYHDHPRHRENESGPSEKRGPPSQRQKPPCWPPSNTRGRRRG